MQNFTEVLCRNFRLKSEPEISTPINVEHKTHIDSR